MRNIYKIARVRNDGTILRYIKVFDSPKAIEKYKAYLRHSDAYYRDTTIEAVRSLSDVAMVDCMNNSVQSMFEIYNMLGDLKHKKDDDEHEHHHHHHHHHNNNDEDNNEEEDILDGIWNEEDSDNDEDNDNG